MANVSLSIGSYLYLDFEAYVTSQSIEKNESTIAWSLSLVSMKSYASIESSVQKKWSVTIDGQTQSGTNYIALNGNETKVIASGTVTVPHNADGSKSVSWSFSQQIDITYSGKEVGTLSSSGVDVLNSIAQKSLLSINNGTLGDKQSIVITKNTSASLEHLLKAECGNSVFYIKSDGSLSTTEVWQGASTASTIQFTPPLEWASQNTTGTSVSVKFTLTTWAVSSGETVGTDTITRTFAIPETVVPSCSITVSEATNYSSLYGGYIKGASKLKGTVNATPSYGSAIASYKTTVDGITYTSATFTTDALRSSGTVRITATVTDKRGRTGTATKDITVKDYSPPVISYLSVHRCNSDGTENDEGEYVIVTYSGSITPLSNLNGHYWELQYKKSAEGDDKYKKVSLNTTAYSITKDTYIFEADTESSYDVKLLVSDNFYNANSTDSAFKPVTMVTSASTAFTIMDFGADGKSVAFGKVAEESGVFDVAFLLRTWKGMLQPILEPGADFNSLLIPNTYTLQNAGSAGYRNCPIEAGTGVLEIKCCGEASQLKQVLTVCDSVNPLQWERFYYVDGSGSMVWYPWKRNFEVVLFDEVKPNNGISSDQLNGTIKLKESAEKFKYIEIFFTDNNGLSGGYSKVYSPNGKTVCLSIVEAAASSYTLIRRTNYSVSGTTITPDTSLAGFVQMTGTALTTTKGTNYIKIKRVVGYE